MNTGQIIIQGARTHNLKNVSLEIPKHKVVVFTGVSGSGKSSLVFETLYTEAQRQLIETFSSFSRRFLPKLSRPPVDAINHLSTAIVIDQKRMGTTLRSTVGTATELYTYLRLLFSRLSQPFVGWSYVFSFNHPEGMCPACQGLGKRIRVDAGRLLDREKTLREGAITHPDYKVGGWNWRELLAIGLFEADLPLKAFAEADLDKLLHAEGIPVARAHGAGTYTKNFEGIIRKLERLYINKAQDELPQTRKDAYAQYFTYTDCEVCGGSRLNPRARAAQVNGKTLPELVALELGDLDQFLAGIHDPVSQPIVTKMHRMLGHLVEIGVGYLSLNRAVATLSGGESQRVKMARQLDCDLVEMMYILDEPSIGLHPKDNAELIAMLHKLRDKGNTVLVVEHDPEVIRAADWVVDVGPQAGKGGGQILFSGPFPDLLQTETLTARHLAAGRGGPWQRRAASGFIPIRNACAHNLKQVSVDLPLGIFTCVTGVAGSGKSSLIHEVFVKQNPGAVVVGQSPVGRTSRSIPVSYLGVFDGIRKEIAQAVQADPSLFSFNAKGACPKCNGQGFLHVEMSFLDDVKTVCDECDGRKYTDDVLAYRYRGKNIFEILNLTVEESLEFFQAPETRRRLQVLSEVGLGYLEIGQPLSSLSGGESQRLKLATELHKRGQVYVMDEPTTGLHLADIARLLAIIDKLVAHHNTVVVIEHNLDVIKRADWVIDLGPLGGARGGEIVATGTPEQIAQCARSHTGRYLKSVL